VSQDVGVVAACEAMGLSRSAFYRHRQLHVLTHRQAPAWALSEPERVAVLAVLHEERFLDRAPPEIYATLLDEGRYLCSIRTMYRLLAACGEVRERRAITRHPAYAKPELLAVRPNQVWSWDITKLRGPTPGIWYHLYVILDIFSRAVVGWLVASVESEHLAHELIATACRRQNIQPAQLKLHADRGSAMRSKTVAELLGELGVEKSHNRPHVSDDNPYSESQFKTLKYHPTFPERFGGLEDAIVFCRPFFHWYNEEHHHSGLALLTPLQVHTGQADAILAQRQAVLDQAYADHPERFPRPPRVRRPPAEVWINQPRPVPTPAEEPASQLPCETPRS
jgi:putative transposase